MTILRNYKHVILLNTMTLLRHYDHVLLLNTMTLLRNYEHVGHRNDMYYQHHNMSIQFFKNMDEKVLLEIQSYILLSDFVACLMLCKQYTYVSMSFLMFLHLVLL